MQMYLAAFVIAIAIPAGAATAAPASNPIDELTMAQFDQRVRPAVRPGGVRPGGPVVRPGVRPVRPGGPVVVRPGVRPVRPGGPVVVDRGRRINPGAAVAAGVIGAAGAAIIGGAIANSQPQYVAPGYVEDRECWVERRPVRNEWGEVVGSRRVRVCE